MLFDADVVSCCNESTYYTGHFTLTMFSLSLGNIVMNVELSSAVGCLHKEKLEYARVTFPIKFEGVSRPCYSQHAKCEQAQACTLKARRCKVQAPRKHITYVSGETHTIGSSQASVVRHPTCVPSLSIRSLQSQSAAKSTVLRQKF